MIIKVFNKLEEIEKYYDKKLSAYIFYEDKDFIDLVIFNFNLNVAANIIAKDIQALNIDAWDINARHIDVNNIDSIGNINALNINALNINANDIKANNIKANDINANDIIADCINANDIIAGDINSTWVINARNIYYHAVCFAYNSIRCKSIEGRKENAKHFVLDGTLEIEK